MKSRVILLDVMDTLVWDPYRLIPGALGMSMEEFLEARNPGAWPAFERGELTEEAFAASYFRDGRGLDMPHLRAVLRGGYRWLDGMEQLLAELRDAGHELHALSNYPSWWEMIEDKLALSRFLSWRFVSCKTGVRKPEAAAYQGAAIALSRPTGDCLFVDDRETNCQGARAVGMASVRYRDAEQLRLELKARGWL